MNVAPRCLLLLPRPLLGFILEDQAHDLLRADGVLSTWPPRPGYGAIGRAPDRAVAPLAAAMAAAVRRRLPAGGPLRVVVFFHPFQLPVAERLAARDGAELWYGVWDRFAEAADATPAQRERLEVLHARASEQAAFVFTASDELARLEREAGHDAVAVGLSADAFPASAPVPGVVAVVLGHLGRRVDWGMLREALERVEDLTLLLIGEVHHDELWDASDFQDVVDDHPRALFLGRQDDRAAAGLIALADCGLLPFTQDPFNDAGLPYRILKAARLGRRTIVPPLAGTRTWARATVEADGPQAVADALRAQAGVRAQPDLGLRAWALAQTAEAVNAPLWERLAKLGVAT